MQEDDESVSNDEKGFVKFKITVAQFQSLRHLHIHSADQSEPDVAVSVRHLQKFLRSSNPRMRCWGGVSKLFRRLTDTPERTLAY